MVHCPIRLSVGSRESHPVDIEPAPSEEHLRGAETSSWGEKRLLLTSTAVGQALGGWEAGSSFGLLTTCPIQAMTNVHGAASASDHSGFLSKCVQGAQKKLHSQALRRAETLGPSSAKDLQRGGLGNLLSGLYPEGLSHTLPVLCFPLPPYSAPLLCSLPLSPLSAHFVSSSSSLGCLWAD